MQGGFGFHSNDARGATQTVEPISPDNPFPTATSRIPALIPTKGAEIGVRTSAFSHLQSTFSLWYLHSDSELQQDGDTGGTVASLPPSNRYGIEWANYYTPLEHLAFDFDIADSRPFSPRSTRMMPRRTARVASAYPKRLGWWFHRASRCTITNAFRRVCACAPLARAI